MDIYRDPPRTWRYRFQKLGRVCRSLKRIRIATNGSAMGGPIASPATFFAESGTRRCVKGPVQATRSCIVVTNPASVRAWPTLRCRARCAAPAAEAQSWPRRSLCNRTKDRPIAAPL